MTLFDGMVFTDDRRRGLVQSHATLNGIDFLEVVTAPPADNQLVLRIYFLPPEPPTSPKLDSLLSELIANPVRITIGGGVRTTGIQVVAVNRVGDGLAVRVNEPGDFSSYTLTIQSASVDPYFSQIEFSFKAGCPSRFDCKPRPYCPPEELQAPAIDYMAKDYASFRQALVDLIPSLVPGWAERHEADLGVTLLELLAYVGDQLSYYQDAVANEAYLESARQRISVRRHARLIDYAMHDGLSAASFIHFRIRGAIAASVRGPRHVQVFTRPQGVQLAGNLIPISDVGRVSEALERADAVFEVLIGKDETLYFNGRLNEITIHTWGNEECYLPRNGTEADLVGDLAHVPGDPARGDLWRLKPGDFLLFEEVMDPSNGDRAGFNPGHRQVVRLVEATPRRDELLGLDLTRIRWSDADALRFPVCVATSDHMGVSVARGNLALAYHGRTITEWHPREMSPGVPGIEIRARERAYRFALKYGPLSYLPRGGPTSTPVATLQAGEPGGAVPAVTQLSVHDGRVVTAWKPAVPDLLANGRFDQVFVVETDNLGRAMLRFGDNEFGLNLAEGSFVEATYRVGTGVEGNVGADTLLFLIVDSSAVGMNDVEAVRNPIAAWGGAEPEAIERVKQVAPAAFRSGLYRAVTEEDYARVAEQHPAVRRAVATFRWTGSWRTVFISIDPAGRSDLPDDLRSDIVRWVARFRMAGYDLEISPPIFVPLMVDLDICASPGYFGSEVERGVLDALSSRVNPGGNRGFFHPDNFTFDQPLFLSKLLATVKQVPGVESVEVTRFARRYEADPDPVRPATKRNLDNGYIDTSRLEIIRLDNDPSFPESGILGVTMRGGQ